MIQQPLQAEGHADKIQFNGLPKFLILLTTKVLLQLPISLQVQGLQTTCNSLAETADFYTDRRGYKTNERLPATVTTYSNCSLHWLKTKLSNLEQAISKHLEPLTKNNEV